MATPKDKLEFKKIVVETALKKTVSAASREFGISRTTISKWLKKFKKNGVEGLKRKNRTGIFLKNIIPSNIVDDIIKFKKENSECSAKDIINHFNLPYSQQAVNGRIRKYFKQNDKKVKMFSKIYLKINKLKQKQDSLPSYQISAYDSGTGALFISFSYERSNLTLSIFIDYLLQNLNRCKEINVEDITIITSSTSVYRLSSKNKISLLDFIIEEKYKAKHDYRHSNYKFPKNYILTDPFYSVKDLLFKSLVLTINNNYYRKDPLASSMMPLDKMRKENPNIDPNILLIPPILIDKHIANIVELKKSKDYSYLQENARTTILENSIKHFNSLAKDYINRDFSKESIEIFNTVEKISKLQKNKEKEFNAIAVKAETMMAIGEWTKAGKEYYRALKLAEKLGNRSYVMKIMNYLGSRANRQARYMEALHYLKKAHDIAEELNDSESLSALNNDIGIVYLTLGKTDKALFYFKRGAEYSKSAKDILPIIKSQIYCGLHFHVKSDYDQAKLHFENALSLAQKYKINKAIIAAKGNMGHLYKDLGNYGKSLKLYVSALRDIRIHRLKTYLDIIYINLGNLFADYSVLDVKDRAEKYYKKAITIAKNKEDFNNLIILYINLGLNYFRKKMLGKAEEYYNKGINLARKIKNDKLYITAVINKLSLLLKLDKYDEVVATCTEIKGKIIDYEDNDIISFRYELIYLQADFILSKLNKNLEFAEVVKYFIKIDETMNVFGKLLTEKRIRMDASIKKDFVKFETLKRIRDNQMISSEIKNKIFAVYDMDEIRLKILNDIRIQLEQTKAYNYSSFLEELNIK